jgi:hypothetical protein
MPPRRMTWLVWLPLLWLARHASALPAPPLMRPPAHVQLTPVLEEFAEGQVRLFGTDDVGAVYGYVDLNVRCWPKGTKSSDFKNIGYLEPGNHPIGNLWLGMTPDHKHALTGHVVEGELRINKFRCDAPVQPPQLQLTAQDDPAVARVNEISGNQGRWLSATPTGEPCVPLRDVIHCYGDDKTIVRSFSVLDAKPTLDINPEWALSMESTWVPPHTQMSMPDEQWYVDALVMAPDGQLYVLMELSLGIGGSGPSTFSTIRWLVKQTADGKILPLTTAFPVAHVCVVSSEFGDTTTDQVNALAGVNKLIYSEQRKAVLGWPALGWELKTLDEQADGKANEGSPALGMRVFPLGNEQHSGYLSMTHAYGQAVLKGYNIAQTHELFERADGSLLMSLTVAKNGVIVGGKQPQPLAQRLYDVKIDADSLDLDGDGITASEEAALGTSDFAQDSDGGGSLDHDELILGTQPNDNHDDLARGYDLHRVTYAISTLIDWRIGDGVYPPPASDPWGTQHVGGERLETEPFCHNGTCRGRSGEVLVTYPAKQEIAAYGRTAQSADDSMVLLSDGDQVDALYVPEGTRHPLTTLPAIAALAGPAAPYAPSAFAAGRHEVYFLAAQNPHRLVLAGDGPPRVVFDLDEVRCASGQGCPSDVGYKDWRYNLGIIGYDTGLHRLWLGITEQNNGSGLAWLIGAHATQPPVLLGNPAQLWGATGSHFAGTFGQCIPSPYGIGLAQWAVNTGHDGELLTSVGRRDRVDSQLPSDLDLFAGPVQRVFGDVLLQNNNGRLYEVVQIEERADPGELLAMTYENGDGRGERSTLWHIPARGGKAEVFSLPKIKFTGMNAAPDGRICLASPDPGVFMQIRDKPLSFGMPSLLITELHVGKVIDCDYGPDGRPHLLMGDPPRVLIWNGKSDTDFETRPLDVAKVPQQLLVNKDGTDRVLNFDDTVLGMGRLQDGSIAEIDAKTQRLRVHGALVGPDLTSWLNQVTSPNHPLTAASWEGLRAHIAQRPDGLIAVLPYSPVGNVQVFGAPPPTTVMVIDPHTGQTGELTPYLEKGLHNPHALAVLPGGLARDPWTGGPIVLAPLAADVDAGGAKPAVATRPKPSSDGGCSARKAVPRGTWLWLVACVVAVWLGRRRRDGRMVASSPDRERGEQGVPRGQIQRCSNVLPAYRRLHASQRTGSAGVATVQGHDAGTAG